MYSLLVLVAAVLALIGSGCESAPSQPEITSQLNPVTRTTNAVNPSPLAPPATPPLLLEDKPLLLEDEPSSASDSGSMADNSRCQVCHLNMVEEELALTHAKAQIGCADCHGASDAHIADESWASGGNGTPPDTMFLPVEINPSCLKCHPQNQVDQATHQAFFAQTTNEKFCTNCHGQHRLVQRKCKWK